ncbi:MAG: hypothetical protein K0S47_504 [Herbinix sp.]|jgi:uncharacterized protein YjdB|nr:hypothetical protein [Herbinix sp.]
MKQYKKIMLSSLFSLLLFAGVITINTATVQAYEVSGFYQYENNDTGVTIIKYTGGELSVNIPSKIAGKKVTSIGNFAFQNNDLIEHVKIPNTVISIGRGAFYDCDSLLDIIIPDSVVTLDSYDWTGEQTFGSCDSLTTVVLGNGLTAINAECFIQCPKLQSVSIGKNVQSINKAAFLGCTGLTGMVIPSSVKTIDTFAFKECTNLKTIKLSEGLNSINRGAFYDCDSLASITIPDSVVILDSYDWTGEQIFGSCDNLTKVVIGDGVTVIKAESFLNCSNLSQVTLGNSILSIEKSAFYNCDKLSYIEIPASVKTIGMFSFKDCSSLKTVVLNYGLSEILKGAFYNCSSLEEILIPNSVINLDSYDWTGEQTFGKCINLRNILIPNSVTTIGKELTIDSPGAVISGYANSYAAQYAVENGLPFEELTSIPADRFTFKQREMLLMVGETGALEYSIDPEISTDAILWKSSDPNIASVDNIGLVTAHSTGSVSIIAATTSGKKASITVIVEEAPKSISFKYTAKTLALDESYSQKAIIDDGSRTDITIRYTSSNPDVLTVNASGKLTLKSTGTAVITAEIFNGLEATYSVTVKKTPTSVSLSPSSITLSIKASKTLKYSIPSGCYTSKYTFKSSNPKIATVDSYGKIVAKGKGTATITITTHNGKKATCKITVK